MISLVQRLDGFLLANRWRDDATFINGEQQGDDLTFGDVRRIRHGLDVIDKILSFDATGDEEFLQEAIREARRFERVA